MLNCLLVCSNDTYFFPNKAVDIDIHAIGICALDSNLFMVEGVPAHNVVKGASQSSTSMSIAILICCACNIK